MEEGRLAQRESIGLTSRGSQVQSLHRPSLSTPRDGETAVSNDYKPRDNKFTGKIVKVTIDTQPSNLSAADRKAAEDAEDAAAAAED